MSKPTHRYGLVAAAGLAGAALAAAAALAVVPNAGAMGAGGIIYAGPKTWAPGWSGEGGFASYYRWSNRFTHRSIEGWGRVAYIDSSGNWTCSFTSYSTHTGCADSLGYYRKPFCRNNDSRTYTGYCDVESW